jgi:hypothetical protein
MNKRLLTAFVIFFLSGSKAWAAGVQIGMFCLDGVSQMKVDANPHHETTGDWHDERYHLARGAGNASARLSIFDRQIPEGTALETCREVEDRMRGLGAQLIVSGRLNTLDISGHVFIATKGGNRFQIDPGKLDVEMGSVDSGERTLGGGKIDLRGAKLWIKNPTRVLVTDSQIQGTFEIEAWNRRIVGFSLAFREGLAYRMELAPTHPDTENVFIRVDLVDGATSLWKGDLTGTPSPDNTAAQGADLGPLTLSGAELTATKANVTAVAGVTRATLSSVKGTASLASSVGATFGLRLREPTFEANSVSAPLTITESGSTLGDTSALGVTIASTDGSVAQANGQSVVEGPLGASVKTLSTAQIDGTSTWQTPHLPILEFLLSPAAVSELKMEFHGAPSNPRLTGTITTASFSLGDVLVSAPTTRIAFNIPQISVSIRVPIAIDFGPVGGSFQVHDAQGTVSLQGDVKTFHAAGDLVLPFPDLAQCHLEIPDGGLRVALGGAVAVSPFIAGVKPDFGAGDIAAANFGPLMIGRTSTGLVTLRANVFVLANPRIRVGSAGQGAAFVNLSLEAQGGATLLHDLADGSTQVAVADIQAQNISATTDGAVLDFDGVHVSSPAVTIASLSVRLDQLGPVKYQEGHLTKLSASAGQVTRPYDASKPTEVTYSAVPTKPVTLEELTAHKLALADNLSFDENDIKTFDLGLARANVDFAGGVKVSDASMTVHLGRAVQASVPGSGPVTTLTDGQFDFQGKLGVTGPISVNGNVGTRVSMHVDGPTDHLTGTGSIGIDAFTGHAQSDVRIDFACETTDHLDVPMEYNFAIAGVNLAATMTSGALTGEANIGPLGLVVHTTNGAECHDKDKKIIIAPATEGWTYGICSKGLEFYRCEWHWSTPEINIIYNIHLAVRFGEETITMTHPRLRLRSNGLNVCNMGAILVPNTIAIGGYSPNIVTNYPDASNLINGLIDATFEPVQSLAVSAIGTGVGWLVSGAATVDGNLMCIL